MKKNCGEDPNVLQQMALNIPRVHQLLSKRIHYSDKTFLMRMQLAVLE